MGVFCLLVEGLTEEIYLEKLLYWIQLPNVLKVSKKLINLGDDCIHPNKIWMKNVAGDGAFGSFIKKNKSAFYQNEFKKIIIIRDLYSGIKRFSAKCKRELCEIILSGIPGDIKERYDGRIFINLSVQEIEAWFFADKNMFRSMKPSLTEAYINSNYGNILSQNPEELIRPSSILKNILLTECNFAYMKHEKEIYRIVSRITMNNYHGLVSGSYAKSLYRLIQFLRSELDSDSSFQ